MALVMPVKARPEPSTFDARVRKPGLAWLAEHKLPASGPVPANAKLEPYWRRCLDELHAEYGGICAYVCVYIEKVTGSRSADHFVPKSAAIEQAYEWSNYRLACGIMNSRKRELDDVLDPFELTDSPFVLDLVSGRISARPGLDPTAAARANATSERLGLDEPECRELRTKYFSNYLSHDISARYLETHCPFVWQEVCRQKAFRKELGTNAPAS